MPNSSASTISARIGRSAIPRLDRLNPTDELHDSLNRRRRPPRDRFPCPGSGSNPIRRFAQPKLLRTLDGGAVELGALGAEDQLGASNLVTPAKRRESVALVRDGVFISLARTVGKDREPYL